VNKRQLLEREKRGQKLAGIAALLPLPCFIAAQIVLASSGFAVGGVLTETFRSFDVHSTAFVAQALITAVLYAVMVIPLYYLFRAAQGRSDRVNPAMLGFVFIGPLLYAASNVVLIIAQRGIASDFVAQAAAGGDIYNLLEDIQIDSTLYQVGQYLQLPAALGLVIALVYVALNAMRVGLLTRFFGTLGIALGVSQMLLPQLGRPAISIWLAWLGFMILDRLPRGRPPAWDVGEAIPWPRPGEEPQPGAPAPDSVVEGDATEAFESDPVDHSARRERAKKKKRKRRR
jgi:hypothetical protein